jgi:YVTN family beta-propeller protein
MVMNSEALATRTLVVLGIVSLVFLAGCGGGTASTANPTPTPNSTPTITTISPNDAVAGGMGFTLTINGDNFVAGSTVNFGGAALAATFVDSTQLTAAIPASIVASTGTVAVTVTNPAPGGGTSNAMNFSITSGLNPVPAISYLYPTCAIAGEQFIGSENNQLTVVGSNLVAGSVVRWNGSDLPTNSNGSINGLTAQISASDIAAAGTVAVTVFNPAPGGGSSNPLTFTITTGAADPQSIAMDPAGKFAYVLDGGCDGDGGYVSMYTINPTTGALASIGLPVSTNGFGVYPGSIAVEPLGNFAYATNEGDPWGYEDGANGSIAIYSIDSTTGALVSTGTINGNCPGLCDPSPIVVDPSGKFAYVVTGGAGIPFNVAMYTIDSTTGALTSNGTTGEEGVPTSMAVDPSGKFLYVASANGTPGIAGDVSVYTINATTGALASIGTIVAGTSPTSVALDPSGGFAYVANSDSNDVSMYTINATTGALASIGTIAAGTEPVSVAVDSAGKFAYVANFESNDVSMYTIDATTGALTPIGTIAAGQSPTSIAIHPSGKFAYVTNSASNDVSIYSIDAATGALTLIGTIGT